MSNEQLEFFIKAFSAGQAMGMMLGFFCSLLGAVLIRILVDIIVGKCKKGDVND
jgi:hypothetical protein